MISISLCMIVKDEEETLARCLDSVRGLVDEIIIVDTGSRDRTKEIAGRYTDRIYDFEWKDDFSAARNFGLAQAEMEYCMWLDADDVIPPVEGGMLAELKKNLQPEADIIMMEYRIAFDQQNRSVFTYYRERIVRNEERFRFLGRVHEAIPLLGHIVYAPIAVEHRKVKTGDGDRNLRIYYRMVEEGAEFGPRELYYFGRELVTHEEYEEAVNVLEQFLRRQDGWLENKIEATRQLAVCYYELGREEEALLSLLRGLEYDAPRGETCCELGRYFFARENYKLAAYWYQTALNCEKNTTGGAFVQEDCYGFLPAIFLCVCYDRMGDKTRAEAYNELAGKWKPDSRYYRQNKEYFESLNEQGQE